jgi:5-methylcytosine-specific restriction protein A
MKLCTVCGLLTSRAGSRCTGHARQSNRSRHNALYSTRAWQRLSTRVLHAWRGEHGNWCPGYRRLAHQASDLTVDHVVPLATGGPPLDVANCSVLCRSCNSTKGASTDRGGVAHRASRVRLDRALPLCARGRVSRIIPASRDVRPRAPQGARPRAPQGARPRAPQGAHVPR